MDCIATAAVRVFNMIFVADAQFVKTVVELSAMPSDPGISEIAFVGRSNVGKSSLINALTRRKGLARVSNTPGRTQAINIFDISLTNKECKENKKFRMIDLPGLGYALASKSNLAFYHNLVSQYTVEREALSVVFHLFDIRRDVTDEDRQIARFLLSRAGAYVLVITKSDKIVKAKRTQRLDAICQGFGGIDRRHAMLTSVEKNEGIEEILHCIWEKI